MRAFGSLVPDKDTKEELWAVSLAGDVTCGAAGACVSTRTVRGTESGEAVPDVSAAVAVKIWLPSLSPDSWTLQVPVGEAIPEPRVVAPSKIVIVVDGSAVPASVITDDVLQVLSAGAVMAGAAGCGAVTVKLWVAGDGSAFPEPSTARTRNE